MFAQARLKLTAWYLLIIMLVSMVFSIVIYTVINREYSRIGRIQRLKLEHRLPGIQISPIPFVDPEIIEEARIRLLTVLVLANLGILAAAGFAGYFLAGRTLKPIGDMIDEQNRFITDSSHELRTPLTALKSEIEVNLRDRNLNLKQARRLLESNLEEVNNLQVLSDSLIKSTQLQKFNAISKFSELNLNTVLNLAIKKVAVLAKHKDIHIKNKAKDVNLEGDQQSLVTLFVVLLDNAIKYSPRGKEVSLTSEKKDDAVMISVVNEGIGISGEDLPHLFNRFYRADKSRTKVDASGYGLGLSIAKQIVEKHRGSIEVKSEAGKGSIFSILLPLLDVSARLV